MGRGRAMAAGRADKLAGRLNSGEGLRRVRCVLAGSLGMEILVPYGRDLPVHYPRRQVALDFDFQRWPSVGDGQGSACEYAVFADYQKQEQAG